MNHHFDDIDFASDLRGDDYANVMTGMEDDGLGAVRWVIAGCILGAVIGLACVLVAQVL